MNEPIRLNKAEKITAIIFFVIGLFLVIANYAYSSERHKHHDNVVNTTNTPLVTEMRGVASAIASSQHHYKASPSLQWSVGAGYINDESAVSFGLGMQTGKVFVSGNFSSDGSASAIGFGASGTF